MGNEKQLVRVVANYLHRCPEGPQKKRDTFPILKWKEEVRQEEQVLRDGVFELMDMLYHRHWSAKPKHGGLENDDADATFIKASKAEGAITDQLGRNAKFQLRVAIKVKDLITVRDADIRSRGMSIEEEKKKATEEDAAAMSGRLQRKAGLQIGHAETSHEIAKKMAESHGGQRAEERCGRR